MMAISSEKKGGIMNTGKPLLCKYFLFFQIYLYVIKSCIRKSIESLAKCMKVESKRGIEGTIILRESFNLVENLIKKL